MARSYARINVGVWENDDFVTLSPNAKLLYFHVISRRDLSPLGSLIIRDKVWARQVFNGDTDALWSALAELEVGRYVFTDADTGELLIRTFLRHDNSPHINWKHASAILGAVDRLDSEPLRTIAETLTGHLPVNPREGDQIDSAPEPIGQSNGQSVAQQNGQSNGESVLLHPSSFILNPSSFNPHPSPQSAKTVIDVSEVAWLVSVLRTQSRPRVKNKVEYARGVYKTMGADGELDDIERWLLSQEPFATPQLAAAAYERADQEAVF
jgi:hypothetical protein